MEMQVGAAFKPIIGARPGPYAFDAIDWASKGKALKGKALKGKALKGKALIKGWQSAAYNGPPSPDAGARCQQWCADHGLEQVCLDMLLSLPPSTREEVMAYYSPKPGTRNPTGLFIGFCRSVQQREGAGPHMGSWGKASVPPGGCWGKGAAAEEWAYAGPGHGVAGLAGGPEPSTAWGGNWSGGLGGKGPQPMPVIGCGAAGKGSESHGGMCTGIYMGPPRVEGPSFAPGFAPSFAPPVKKAWQPPLGPLEEGDADAPVPVEQIQDFLRHWGLDDSVSGALSGAPPAAQRETMAIFAPKEGTRNINGLFIGFLRSIAAKYLGGASAGGMATGAYLQGGGLSEANGLGEGSHEAAWNLEAAAAQASAGAVNGAGDFVADDGAADEVSQFCKYWSLDLECTSALRGTPPEVQRVVLDGFSPKAGTRNPQSLFMGYLRSVATRMATEVGAAHPPAGAYLDGQEVLGAFGAVEPPPAEPLLLAGDFGTAAEMPAVREVDVTTFALEHGLDYQCAEELLAQPEAVQLEVMQRFRPKEGTRDTKNLFMSFVKSVASGLNPSKHGRFA